MSLKAADIAFGIALAGFMSTVFVIGVSMAGIHLVHWLDKKYAEIGERWRK